MAIQAVNAYNSASEKISSGYRINRAADDAAGLAVSEKLQKEANGLETGASNVKDGIGALNIADGGLDGMTDNLQRIRELSVKAMNGLYSDDERGMIQEEISQLLQGVQDYAKNTQYNSMELLDGSMASMDIASDPNGGGLSIKMANATLKNLGLEGYDVTKGDFDISVVDKALEQIVSSRSQMGAQSNRLDHTYNYNMSASLQQTASYSRVKDLDMAEGISEKRKQELLRNYQTMMLRKKMDNDAMTTRLFQ